MNGAPLAFAFGAGMLATVNPCGFSMLPAYLSYFLGLEGRDAADVDGVLPRAIAVSLCVTAGFVAVFGLMGIVITQLGGRVQEQLPWVTIVIGIALVGLGIAALSGRQITLKLPKVQRASTGRELGSMLLFGISYAVSSLSCTIGPFLAATSSTFSDHGMVAGIATFVAYGLGMGAIVTVLTVAVALARNSIVARFRAVLRYVNRISGVLLLVAGAYLAYYGWYEIRLRDDISTRDPIVDRAIRLQSWIAEQISRIGTGRLGLFSAVVVLLAIGSIVAHRRATRARRTLGRDDAEGTSRGAPDRSEHASV